MIASNAQDTLLKGLSTPSDLLSRKGGFVIPSEKMPHQPELTEATRCLAIARSGPFWFEPFFGESPKELGTLLEIALLVWERSDGDFGVLLPLADMSGRASLSVDSVNGLSAAWHWNELSSPRTSPTAFILSTHADPFRAVRIAFEEARDCLGTFRLRQEKKAPSFINKLGWCTWDAFYQDVTAEGILDGLDKLKSGGITPGFLIIDDGWQNVANFRMVDFSTDETKFPKGLKPVISAAKETYGIEHVGVWHALQGYWRGVDPEGPFAKSYEIVECTDISGTFDGWPEQFDTRLRHLIAPKDSQRFYSDFHKWLKESGVDFVKIDNQAMMEQFAGETLPRVSTQLSYQHALQESCSSHFDEVPIHCMCNVSEIFLNLSFGNLWRNTDDFFPLKPDSYQSEFVTWNAYNNLLSSNVATPDWDMFQTKSKHARFHAVARAISGGPIYLSDKPGEHDFELIRKISLPDSTVPRWPEPARLARDRILEDPRRGGRLLKVTNARNNIIGTIALFNVAPATTDETAPSTITDTFSPSDVSGILGDRFAVFDCDSQNVQILKRDQKQEITLGNLKANTRIIAPIQDTVAALGSTEHFNGAALLESAFWTTDNAFTAILSPGEYTASFYSQKAPSTIELNDLRADARYDERTKVYRIRLSGTEKSTVTLRF